MIGGNLKLSGSVPSYYLKQVAQETVMRLGLSAGVENGVAVHPASGAWTVDSDG